MKKPKLETAEIIKKTEIPENMLKFLSPALIAHLEKQGMKEIGTDNMAVGEWFVIERYVPSSYHKFATDGSRSELSVFRMAGGCNHLDAFECLGAEKSEDYDTIPDSSILCLPDEFDDATEIIEKDYIGKKLRVVARSAEGMDQYGHRYYLFSVE